MAYTINKTDGTILATVPDGQIDNLSSDITLIGKNYSGFGEALNENFVKILENFASASRPSKPVRGQIWYDTTEKKLKVYSGTGFVPVSSATIASVQPSNLGVGDLWFNDVDKQLYFYDGVNTILLGPSYSQSQSLSGFLVESILDNLNQTRVITSLWNNGTLLGIFATEAFTPKLPITGFSGSIVPGFNAGTIAGFKLQATAANAEKLDNILASNFARRDQTNIFTGQVSITTNNGLAVGDGLQASLQIDVGNVILANTAQDRNLFIRVRKGVVSENAIEINSASRSIKLYDGQLTSQTTVGGNLVVQGDLTVNGETTTVNTTVLTVEDKNIVLGDFGDSSLNTDEYADGGGMILKGASQHEFIWDRPGTAWFSTEHINLATGKEYKIDGVSVLSKTSLGPTVTSIPGVTSFGTQVYVDVGPVIAPATTPTAYMRLEDNRISTVETDLDLELAPDGAGDVVLIGNPKIEGLVTTNEASPSQTAESASLLSATELSEATSKKYVTNLVRTRSLVFSMDISDAISNSGIAAILTSLAPPAEYQNGTLARILCSSINLTASVLDINSLLSKNNTVEYLTPSGSNFPLQDVAVAPASVSPPTVLISRVIKTYQLISGAWTFIS